MELILLACDSIFNIFFINKFIPRGQYDQSKYIFVNTLQKLQKNFSTSILVLCDISKFTKTKNKLNTAGSICYLFLAGVSYFKVSRNDVSNKSNPLIHY